MKRPADHPTLTLDGALDAGLAAAFGKDDLTAGGWTRPPLLRDEPSDYSPIVRPDSNEMAKADANRYQLFGEIARGGMGVILKGRDPDLGRDLAVKVLRTEFTGKAVAEQRFVEEAQVGGQLQHPGVVPVYELGRFTDGRPFFTMKLVKGRTLSALLADRPSPQTERGRFLKVFEQIAQTIAYAHSKGVIHRDIKPANVMVGSFGEVQVMDWGLAKVLPQGGVADEKREQTTRTPRPADQPDEPTVIRTVRTGSTAGSETEAGSMMGTPAYMPPEQAGGEMDKLDERADVFGLGAVLCVILTGDPPYVSDNGEKLRLMALRGNLDDCFKRLDDCGADAELVAHCKRCLAKEPADRPRHGGEVADAIHLYLADVEERAHKAEVERVKSEAETRGERKRRKVQALLGSTVLATVLIGGLLAGWQWMRAESESTKTRIALDQVSTEKDKTTAALAKLQDEQARSLAALNTMTDEGLERIFNSQQEITDDQKSFMRKLAALYDEATISQLDTDAGKLARAKGYARVGKLRNSINDTKGAIETLTKAESLFDELIRQKPGERDVQFERWQSRHTLGPSYKILRQEQQYEAIVRQNITELESVAGSRELDLRERILLGKSWNNLFDSIRKQPNRQNESYVAITKGIQQFRECIQIEPADVESRLLLANCLMNLGGTAPAGREQEQKEALLESIRVLESVQKQDSNDPRIVFVLAGSHQNLGVYYSRTKQLSLMLEEMKMALELNDLLSKRFPANPKYQASLAEVHMNMEFAYQLNGNQSLANEHNTRAHNIYNSLCREYPSNREYLKRHGVLLFTLANRATIKSSEGKVANADYYQRAIDRFQTVLALPGGSRREDLGLLHDSHFNFAQYLINNKNYLQAIDIYRRALSLILKLQTFTPDDPVHQRIRSVYLTQIGHCYLYLKRYDAAERYFARAEELQQTLIPRLPNDTHLVKAMADVYHYRSELYAEKGDPEKCIDWLKRERQVLTSFRTKSPEPTIRERIADVELKLGGYLGLMIDKVEEARNSTESSLREIQSLIMDTKQKQPVPVQDLNRYRQLESRILVSLAVDYLNAKEFAKAEQFARSALAMFRVESSQKLKFASVDEYHALAECLLGVFQAHRGEYADADRAIQKALQLDPNNAIISSMSASVLAQCSKFAIRDTSIPEGQRTDRSRIYADRAMGYLRRSIEQGLRDAPISPSPKEELHKSTDYDPLRDREDFKKLLAEFDASHEMLPMPQPAKSP